MSKNFPFYPLLDYPIKVIFCFLFSGFKFHGTKSFHHFVHVNPLKSIEFTLPYQVKHFWYCFRQSMWLATEKHHQNKKEKKTTKLYKWFPFNFIKWLSFGVFGVFFQHLQIEIKIKFMLRIRYKSVWYNNELAISFEFISKFASNQVKVEQIFFIRRKAKKEWTEEISFILHFGCLEHQIHKRWLLGGICRVFFLSFFNGMS